jgi:hypothetical protein
MIQSLRAESCPTFSQPAVEKRIALQSARNWLPIPLLLILTLGLAARFRQYLGCPSYWYDEAYLLLNVFDKSLSELLGQLGSDQAAPPIFLWILRLIYRAAGSTEWAMRFPAALASLAAPLALIPLSRKVAGAGWAWAVALCAVSVHGVTHGYEVKPYALDLLITLLVLWAAVAVIRAEAGMHEWGWMALYGLALLGPWISFPSIFILGGAGLALLVRGKRSLGPVYCLKWLGYCILLVISFALLWWTAGRKMNSAGLQDYWGKFFWDLSTPQAAACSVIQCIIDIGNYGTTGMGIPLFFLAAVGMAAFWQNDRALFVLFLGSLLLAGSASALHRYPLNDRLLFFLVPCVWLPAANGLGRLLQRSPVRMMPVALTIASILVLPGAVRVTKYIVRVSPKIDFREGFAYVQDHERSGDVLWTAYPEVYRVYHPDRPAPLGWATPLAIVKRAALGGRLWIVSPPSGPDGPVCPEVFRCLETLHLRIVEERQLTGLWIRLYEPNGLGTSPTTAGVGRFSVTFPEKSAAVGLDQPTGVLSRLSTRTSSVVNVVTHRVLPSLERNSTSIPSGGKSSTTVPTSPSFNSQSAGALSTATISSSLGSRDFLIG